MQHELLHRPVSTLCRFRLEPGEQIVAEPGAMVGMSPNVQMATGFAGSGSEKKGLLGKLAGAAGRMLTGESFFQNTYTAQGGPGELLLAHTLPGDMAMIELPSHGVKMQSAAYIASTTGTKVGAELGGSRTFFGGEGLFVIGATPTQPGDHVLVGAFGGIEKMPVDGSIVVDTGHLVAWESSLQFNVTKAAGGWISTFLSGEGMVCSFTGQGNIWIQTRHPSEYGVTMGRLLPPRTN